MIVAADHEMGYLLGLDSGESNTFSTIVNNGSGVLPSGNWNITKHTKTLVPLYVRGLGSNEINQFVSGSDQKYGIFVGNTFILALLEVNG